MNMMVDGSGQLLKKLWSVRIIELCCSFVRMNSDVFDERKTCGTKATIGHVSSYRTYLYGTVR
jgi:hypothetical protein